MNRKIAARAFLCLGIAGILLGSAGCGKDKDAETESDKDKTAKGAAADIVNGSFEAEHESGQWVGWTRSGSSFNARGLSDKTEMNGVPIEKDGNFFFCGTAADNPAMKGTLTSDVFTLGEMGLLLLRWVEARTRRKYMWSFLRRERILPSRKLQIRTVTEFLSLTI